jgi:hypothetical protein
VCRLANFSVAKATTAETEVGQYDLLPSYQQLGMRQMVYSHSRSPVVYPFRIAFLPASFLKNQNSTCKYLLTGVVCACLFLIACHFDDLDCLPFLPPTFNKTSLLGG